MARGENNVRYAQAPPTRAASVVYVTLAAQVLSLGALVIFEHSRGRRLATQLAAFGGRPHGADADAVVGAVTVFAVLMMLVVGTTVAAAAAYVTWLVRARQVNDRSAPAGPVAAAWLIPGVNLIAPLLLVDEVWRGAGRPHDRRPRWLALLAAWWLTWLATLALVTTRLPLGSSDGLTGIGLPELTCATVSALLCAATVRDITGIQCSTSRVRSRARLRTAATVTQLPPPTPEPTPLEQTG
ncbi:DUF4328 domain-containing protein [Nonomuraea sp. NEAU-A123]|uniref:DUF4328 domain-containing protein n=1 Tax=Nonomuraea sp. NEAU-A123 TaxID=2839649 RepID=UPI001BE48F69|nr:DUF4328 domain-containing protein [Nonomuraea sp. NEAU-A123]MBT2228446.1 DUF4328 domain-containing protein [Nonomuraea sp. NEAU-A123]